MRHVSLVPHEALSAVIAPEGEVSCVATLVAHQLVSVTELFLTIVTGVSEGGGRGLLLLNFTEQVVV